jgi:hypothetical protein
MLSLTLVCQYDNRLHKIFPWPDSQPYPFIDYKSKLIKFYYIYLELPQVFGFLIMALFNM